ncbi:hypothetical protein M9Y10_022964 [Tritrichomonas musculus]|uniref:Uncharacterized protein n=1 Tax=Tritrichomonas musculus TaxID=1915356 RepID=A0ABR2KX29_9EUKA
MSKTSRSSSSRLNLINQENDDLDAEIESLYHDLQSDSNSDENQNSIDDEIFSRQSRHSRAQYQGNSSHNRLYSDSVEVLEKRNHLLDHTFDDIESSELLLPKQTIRIRGYKPPSERIYESVNKKRQFMQEAEYEKRQKFEEEYTFRPQINEMSRQMPYDPSHLIENKSNNSNQDSYESQFTVVKTGKFINPQSKQIAERTKSDFYSRQFRKPLRSSHNTEQNDKKKKKKLSASEQNELVERLTKPKEPIKPPQVTQTPKRTKRSDPQVFERLASQSVKKQAPKPVEFQYSSKMDPKSREITKGINQDLFEESLILHERQRRRAEEEKQWQDMAEALECSFQPTIRRNKIPTPRKAQINGMDDFLERMRKGQQESERKKKLESQEVTVPKRHFNPIIITAQSNAFQKRQKTVEDINKSIDAVLSEINMVF